MADPSADFDLPVCDPTRKFVRITQERADGMISFEFAIGWPELFVELLLPRQAFKEFCVTHGVQPPSS